MKSEKIYQPALIVLAFLVLGGVLIFLYDELFPQYKLYQNAYKELEEFRSDLTGAPPAPFETGIKQVVRPDPENGPEIIDRCISCHVTMDLPHFSPTKVARDVNGNVLLDSRGQPIQEKNPDYLFDQVDRAISVLEDKDVIEQLEREGKTKEIASRLTQSEKLKELTKMKVEGKEIDLRKVLVAHPLIGNETRPFELHPIESYGCTSCHSGNGRALVAKRAHGPLYDGEYEPADLGPKPEFLEKDRENDPPFSRMYNSKPGHDLVFQTTPLLGGPLIEAACAQCHQSSKAEIQRLVDDTHAFLLSRKELVSSLAKSLHQDEEAKKTLVELKRQVAEKGVPAVLALKKKEATNPKLTFDEVDKIEAQLSYLEKSNVEERIQKDLRRLSELIEGKRVELKEREHALSQMELAKEPLARATKRPHLLSEVEGSVDVLLSSYERGKELYISQACYACHRIAGFSRSSVGPDLTQIGLSYPWYVKESIVWPQADLASSTMPNFQLDHEELQDLMAFLMAQRGQTKTISEVDYAISLREWESGELMPWEEPVPPTEIQNVSFGMRVFAEQGCAACHKLEGFTSNVSFAEGKTLDERLWFYKIFPENIAGSRLAMRVEENRQEIDEWIVRKEAKATLLDQLMQENPELVRGFYSNFRFASRRLSSEDQERLTKVLMLYIELYGFGRDIAPHLSWSGIFRSDAWLMGHFHNPSAYTAKSIMPVIPFDDSKFYALNFMLHTLGIHNRDALHEIWKEDGFNPPLAYQLLCMSCHGESRQGNGIISEWLYPIPKNLRNPIFLRTLTKERALDSILHGVPGTPMPPWGESVVEDHIPVLSEVEAKALVDWLYQGLPEERRRETPEEAEKWRYNATDVVESMEASKHLLTPLPKQDHDLVDYYFQKEDGKVMIRKKFATHENLEEAQELFVLHCASCHGKEGAGTGLRASSMLEAKPRTFLNLPWIQERDDLRLIRSIKFGVPGTSMTPWGDLLSSKQQMQLALYIRSLSDELVARDQLEDVLYSIFDEEKLRIEESRQHEYQALASVEAELLEVSEKRVNASLQGENEQAAALYLKELKLQEEKKRLHALDEKALEQIATLTKIETYLRELGDELFRAVPTKEVQDAFFSYIQHSPLEITFENQKLQIQFLNDKASKQDEEKNQIVKILNQQIEPIEKRIRSFEKEPLSADAPSVRASVYGELGTLVNLRTKFLHTTETNRTLEEELHADTIQ